MTILVSNEQVRAHYSMEHCVAAVESAFAAAGREGIDVSERKVVAVEGQARLLSLTAASSEFGRLVAHVYSGAPSGQDKRQSSVNQRQKLYLLFDALTGACKAIIGGAYLSWLKTGAMGAVAIKHLSSPSAERLAVIGSGRQARAALAGALVVRKFSSVTVWNRTPANAERMIMEFPDLPAATVARSAEEAVQDADVVITSTTATTPVVFGDWLANGCHVNAIGAHYPDHREIDAQAVHTSTVVVDTAVAARAEKGDLLLAERDGAFSFSDVAAELGQVVAGAVPWTRPEGTNTLFASCGSAIESLGAACGVLGAIPDAERQGFTF